jgi:Uma2 family endonuclease
MSQTAETRATYEDLYNIPDNMTGEIISGRLIVTPRPSRRHGYAASSLSSLLIAPFQFGESGGPGDWILLIEPEIALDQNILAPDIAGWKRRRFPVEEDHNWISAVPDWVCELLSPSTAKTDKTAKMPLYARSAVGCLWLVDPIARTLDVFRLMENNWVVAGLYEGNDKVRAEPFQAVEIDLGLLWLEREGFPSP